MSLAQSCDWNKSAAEIVADHASGLSEFPFTKWSRAIATTRITLCGAVTVHDDIGRRLGEAKFTVALSKSTLSLRDILAKLDVAFISSWDEKMAEKYDLEELVKSRIRSACTHLLPPAPTNNAPTEQIILI